MRTIDTKAYVAEKEVEKILSCENHIYRPWQLAKHSLEPARLVCAKEEFDNYLEVDAFLRPGFEVNGEKVTVSHLFCKVDGNSSQLIDEISKLKESNKNIIEIQHGFNHLNNKPMTQFFSQQPEWYDDENGIDVDRAALATLDALGELRPAYRANYLRAVNRVIKAVSGGALLVNPPTPRVILETLIYNSRLIVEMYHNFDYQYMVPKFISLDENNNAMNAYAALRLMLMNELSFDVIIFSDKAYSSIENIISPDEYDLYILDDDGSENLNKNSKKVYNKGGRIGCAIFYVVASLIAVFVLLQMILGFVGM